MGATHSASSQEELQQRQGLGLQVLLSLLALLLLLLGGSLLLAWRMLRKRVKAGEHPEPLQTPSQVRQAGGVWGAGEGGTEDVGGFNRPTGQWKSECIVDGWTGDRRFLCLFLSLRTLSLQKGSPEELHYSTVAFDSQSPDSKANRIHSQKTLEREPEYSVIKQT
ncbi:CMRF35-like molecule 8 [Suricata suricatta]|uniref:CMRF35-like molecule 8 n=1 Tax=Suricata suricatta TaxID=37032 RepID=UPI001155DFA5|nr:CMRF35-like molecule 8 [Suricata suricatta]